jgi:ParB family chromosome partitioning protein
MSKRQADYLSSILNDDAPAVSTADVPAPEAPPSPAPQAAPRTGMTLLARESALARVAAGDVKQVTELLLDPARVRVWQGNPRHQASLTEDSCRDLIDAILAEGGQKVPAVVRRIQDDPHHDYEVIAGTRRHWAISWLRANSYPEMRFLAQVHQLDDEAAFRLSDIENRARKDVSDFERARTYLKALGQHYHGKQARMAERLHISKGWLSKLLTVAGLPDWIVDAFASPADIQLKTCYPFAQKVQSIVDGGAPALLNALKAEARKLAQEQMDRRATGAAPVSSADVLARLTSAGTEKRAEAEEIRFDSGTGRTALSVLSANRNGISIRLHAGSGASHADLADMLKKALRALDAQGRALK